jgi:hypothetical protein
MPFNPFINFFDLVGRPDPVLFEEDDDSEEDFIDPEPEIFEEPEEPDVEHVTNSN